MIMSAQEIQDLKDKVEDIHKALLGDLYNPDGGMVKRLVKVESYVEADKIQKSNLKGKVWGIVLIGTPLIAFGTSLIYWAVTK